MEMSRLTRDGTAEPVSRDQILRRERGQRNIIFPCSANHEQDWQPYPVDPYSWYTRYVITIHTYIIFTHTSRKNLARLFGKQFKPARSTIEMIAAVLDL